MSHWNVLPHGALERHEHNLRSVEGSLPRMKLRRRMVLVRLSDGRLVIHSAVALPEAHMREIEAWGEPAFLIVPNAFHRADAPAYKARYPQLRVLCPREARSRVEKVVAVDDTLEGLPSDPALAWQPLDGTRGGEPLFLAHSEDRVSLIFTDLVFNHPHVGGLSGAVMRLIGSTGGPRITRLARAVLIEDPQKVAAQLRSLAQTPGLARIVVCHGHALERSPEVILETLAARL